MDRGTWQATVQRVAKSRTPLSEPAQAEQKPEQAGRCCPDNSFKATSSNYSTIHVSDKHTTPSSVSSMKPAELSPLLWGLGLAWHVP